MPATQDPKRKGPLFVSLVDQSGRDSWQSNKANVAAPHCTSVISCDKEKQN